MTGSPNAGSLTDRNLITERLGCYPRVSVGMACILCGAAQTEQEVGGQIPSVLVYLLCACMNSAALLLDGTISGHHDRTCTLDSYCN